MRCPKDEINKLRLEYPDASRKRKNEIFESLSHYAKHAGQNVYLNLKTNFPEICDYEECIMCAYEKMHNILLGGNIGTDIYLAVYKACKKDMVRQYKGLINEREAVENNKIELSSFADEENWDDVLHGSQIWKLISHYYINEKRKEIVEKFFGLNNENPCTKPELVRMYNTSRGYIKEILSNDSLYYMYELSKANLKKQKLLNITKGTSYSAGQLQYKFGVSKNEAVQIIKLKNIEENQ